MMMKRHAVALMVSAALALSGCQTTVTKPQPITKESVAKSTQATQPAFIYEAEQFADLRLLRYQIKHFDQLSLQKKRLAYYLYEAALSGRDIIWDQNYRHNLAVRDTLEQIWLHYKGDRETKAFQSFMTYTKRVWFSNGIHHHYSNHKLVPAFSVKDFSGFLNNLHSSAKLPLAKNETLADFTQRITPIIFDASMDAKKVEQADGKDKLAHSAVNFYAGVSEKEATDFYQQKFANATEQSPSFGLNTRLVKQEGKLVEQTYQVGGLYGESIERIVFWLNKAITVAENPQQKKTLALLVEYYQTGDLRKFDEYNIEWVKDTQSELDTINGFIEVYSDPLAYKGSFEAMVSMVDKEATKRIAAIADAAQWFEDNSPIDDAHKKAEVSGITGRAINVIVGTGDASPSSPIGINLPNANWIRAEHGSKSVNLANLVSALEHAKGGALEEFAYDEAQLARGRAYGGLSDDLHTDLHEVIGHASGKLLEGVGTPAQTLKQYASTLEEARADLVALYYLLDEKLVDLGVMPSLDVGKAQYDAYIHNGLFIQLRRLAPGEVLEEAHMRNRQLIAKYAFEKGAATQVIAQVKKEGKTYFVINDYQALRTIFGELLNRIQAIKSVGDFEAGKALVERYGVQVDSALHKEVLARYEALNIAPYSGFIQPKLVPVYTNGQLSDVRVEYPREFSEQMLEFGQKYHYLSATKYCCVPM